MIFIQHEMSSSGLMPSFQTWSKHGLDREVSSKLSEKACHRKMFRVQVVILALAAIFIQDAVAPPPGLYDGQTWVDNPGCPRGGVYMLNNRQIRCHCWGRQGYICEPNLDGTARGGRGGFVGGGANGGCPPGTTVCVINDNTNTNSNTNTNANTNRNRNRNGNRNGNGGSNDYGSDYSDYS